MATNEGKNLVKNTLIYAVGNFGSKILSFLLLPLYSFYLSAQDFGIYDLVIATVALLIPFTTAQISDATYRWLLDAKEDRYKQSVIISSSLAVIIVFSGAFYALYYIALIFIHHKYTGYFAAVLLFSFYLPFFQQVVRGLGKNKHYAIAGIINTFLVLTSNICFLVFFKFGLQSLFIASIISNVLTIVFIIVSAKIQRLISAHNIDIQEIKKMLAYSWPLIPNSISWWLINIADKYIILYILNIEANGIYAVSSRFPAIISLFNSIFLMAWQDHGITATENSDSKKFFSKTFDMFITFELTLVIFLISISQYLVKYLINFKFYESYKYMPMLYIGVAYSAFAAYIGVGYQRAKATKDIFKTTLIGGLINVSISVLLLKRIGLYAPALGTFVSFLVIYVIRKYQTNKFFSIEVNNYKLVGLTAVAIFYSFEYSINDISYRIASIVVALIFFIFLNRGLFFDGLAMVKGRVKKVKAS